MMGFGCVPQRASKVAKSLDMLRKQDEFRLVDELDEADILGKPWKICFEAPSNSPYNPQNMKVLLGFPSRFPFEPPTVQFLTKVYHPNIDGVGTICLDLLKPLPAGSWKPSIDVITLLTAVKLLLAEPNPDDPLMPDIAAEYRENIDVYLRNAKEVSLTGELKIVKEVPAIEGVPRPEKKSLLKRKNTSETESVQISEPVVAEKAAAVEPVTVLPVVVDPVTTVPVDSIPINTPQSEPISLISDDDDFEMLPSKPKKPTLLSCKKRNS